MGTEHRMKTDVLVVGAGIAGWFAAVKAKEQGADVILVDKGYIGKAGQSPFGGGFTVFNPEWGHDLDKWMERVNFVSEYLNNRYWTKRMFLDSYDRAKDLISWGVEFVRDENGELLHRTWDNTGGLGFCVLAGCARADIPYEQTTGYTVRKYLTKIGVNLIDNLMITDILEENGRVSGAVGITSALMDDFDTYVFEAKTTVFCVGACGFKPAGYPMIVGLTCDGEAIAYRHGGDILGKEFVQPMFTTTDAPSILGRRGIPKDKEKEMGNVKGVFGPKIKMDGSVIPKRREPFSAYNFSYLDLEIETHLGHGPVYWNAEDGTHQVVGGGSNGMSMRHADGLWPVGENCGTSLPGLYAAGDALGAMQDGAMYIIGGGAMAGCAVTGAIAGTSAAKEALGMKDFSAGEEEIQRALDFTLAPTKRTGGFSPRWVTQLLQNTMMPYYISYVKKADRLEATITLIEFMKNHLCEMLIARDAHELRLAHETANMVLSAEMRLRSALFRTESRGEHYREDYPRRDDENWLAWTKIRKNGDKMELVKVPVPEEWRPDPSIPYEERYLYRFPGELEEVR